MSSVVVCQVSDRLAQRAAGRRFDGSSCPQGDLDPDVSERVVETHGWMNTEYTGQVLVYYNRKRKTFFFLFKGIQVEFMGF